MEDRWQPLKACDRSLGEHLVVQLWKGDVRRRDFDGAEFRRVNLVDSIQQRQNADRTPVLLIVRVYRRINTLRQTDKQTDKLTHRQNSVTN